MNLVFQKIKIILNLNKNFTLNRSISKNITNLLSLRLKSFLVVVTTMFIGCTTNHEYGTTFTSLEPEVTGVFFNNQITESDSFNIITYEYIYNGGGVAIADFNNDDFSDILFTGNMVSNKLYLNQGDFTFLDITEDAGIGAPDRWCSGVAVVDINADGLKDIYICATTYNEASLRQNLLFINQGVENNHVQFKEMAKDYNLADTSYTTNANFFDYDNDGDLDVFLIVNQMDYSPYQTTYSQKKQNSPFEINVDKLFRNDWDSTLNHPVFTDVSEQAGITIGGYGLGMNIADINGDGWKDVYISNDFLTNDVLYINNQNGTFSNQLSSYFKHTSYSAMGNDINDLNNDGRPEVLVLDMLPEDNYRRKTMLGPNNYSTYINNEKYGYNYQYTRNTLQLNLGGVSNQPIFGEISFFAGIHATDWSWAPLVVDFDNDGFRDIIITNGFPKDITDQDFIDYRANSSAYASIGLMLEQIPEVKLKNYAYRNNGDLTFEDVTIPWGITKPSFSNGASYGDLDNDGDLDYVVNNINDKAFIYRNQLIKNKSFDKRYLRVRLRGSKLNSDGLGAFIELHYGAGQKQRYEQNLYRGYLSTIENVAHFGLNDVDTIDEVVVIWPDKRLQVRRNVLTNQLIEFDIYDAEPFQPDQAIEYSTIFIQDTTTLLSKFLHAEQDVIDFNVQPLLPHKLSQYGPALSVGDIDNDGLDDIYISGSYGIPGTFFTQTSEGGFHRYDYAFIEPRPIQNEELGSLLFDADMDGDLDLYIASGGYEFAESDSNYLDRLYRNDQGRFTLLPEALPEILTSNLAVKAADFDQDGDLDLFVGGRVRPTNYPLPLDSYILRNEFNNGKILFSNATADVAPELMGIGMVTDALWTDFDNDGWVDLIIAGEWMPIKFFRNNKGVFEELKNSGLDNYKGWWNSLAAGDFDNDGDMDYIVGNLGKNSLIKASKEYPVNIYASDFDNNGAVDAIPSLFFKDSTNGNYEEFPLHGRADFSRQLNRTKTRYTSYKEFAVAPLKEVLQLQQIDSFMVLSANHLASSYIENRGKNKFTLKHLPYQAQMAPIYGMLINDFDNDGNLDVLMVGNDYGTELSIGRYDALNGILLSGNGDGTFENIDSDSSGFLVRGDAKSLVKVYDYRENLLLISGQNRGQLKIFHQNYANSKAMRLLNDDFYANIYLANGTFYKVEFTYGSGFLSQSSRFLEVPATAKKVIIYNYQNEERVICF